MYGFAPWVLVLGFLSIFDYWLLKNKVHDYFLHFPDTKSSEDWNISLTFLFLT